MLVCASDSMVKVVVCDLKKGGQPSLNVSETQVRDADGRRRTVRRIDVASPSFGADLTYVFRKNVAKARRDNKRIVGVSDIVPSKP